MIEFEIQMHFFDDEPELVIHHCSEKNLRQKSTLLFP